MATLGGTLKLQQAVVSLVQSDLTNPANIVVSGTAGATGGGSSRIDSTVKEGQFRQYANGVVRLILGSNTARTQTLAMRACSPTEVATLRALAGLIVCFRDTYGRKVFGAYLQTDVTDIPLSGDFAAGTLLTDVSLQIQSVTFSEAV